MGPWWLRDGLVLGRGGTLIPHGDMVLAGRAGKRSSLVYVKFSCNASFVHGEEQ